MKETKMGKNPNQLLQEMQLLIEMEDKVFKERIDLEKELSKCKGRKMKIKVLKERLNESYANSLVEGANFRLKEQV